jgi:hypothetical protein
MGHCRLLRIVSVCAALSFLACELGGLATRPAPVERRVAPGDRGTPDTTRIPSLIRCCPPTGVVKPARTDANGL